MKRVTNPVPKAAAIGIRAVARPVALVSEHAEETLLSRKPIENYFWRSVRHCHVISSLTTKPASLGRLQILDLIFSVVTTSKTPRLQPPAQAARIHRSAYPTLPRFHFASQLLALQFSKMSSDLWYAAPQSAFYLACFLDKPPSSTSLTSVRGTSAMTTRSVR